MLSLIVPVFNEEENIIPFYTELRSLLSLPYELIWVDDGSTDQTLSIIKKLSADDPLVRCISFSRNFGHQNAIVAGLKHATGNIIVIMDGDLQHPLSLIPQMIEKIKEGFDIVYTSRLKTENIGMLKKMVSKLFYKMINLISDTRIREDSADFKAFNKKVLTNILSFDEREIFLRGIFSWTGFKSTSLTYTAVERKYGETKYSYSRMFNLGIRGITSFWVKPLRIALWTGFIICFLTFILAVWAVIEHLEGHTILGWTSLIIAIMFFGGVQLFFLGLIGEYIGSIFIEVKKRPLYIINETINLEESGNDPR